MGQHGTGTRLSSELSRYRTSRALRELMTLKEYYAQYYRMSFTYLGTQPWRVRSLFRRIFAERHSHVTNN
eukprot:4154058-Pleurochrysis_carterae.AAC.4